MAEDVMGPESDGLVQSVGINLDISESGSFSEELLRSADALYTFSARIDAFGSKANDLNRSLASIIGSLSVFNQSSLGAAKLAASVEKIAEASKNLNELRTYSVETARSVREVTEALNEMRTQALAMPDIRVEVMTDLDMASRRNVRRSIGRLTNQARRQISEELYKEYQGGLAAAVESDVNIDWDAVFARVFERAREALRRRSASSQEDDLGSLAELESAIRGRANLLAKYIVEGITTVKAQASQAASTTGAQIGYELLRAIDDALGIASPSKEMRRRIAVDVPAGALQGLDAATRTMRYIGGALGQALSSQMGTTVARNVRKIMAKLAEERGSLEIGHEPPPSEVSAKAGVSPKDRPTKIEGVGDLPGPRGGLTPMERQLLERTGKKSILYVDIETIGEAITDPIRQISAKRVTEEGEIEFNRHVDLTAKELDALAKELAELTELIRNERDEMAREAYQRRINTIRSALKMPPTGNELNRTLQEFMEKMVDEETLIVGYNAAVRGDKARERGFDRTVLERYGFPKNFTWADVFAPLRLDPEDFEAAARAQDPRRFGFDPEAMKRGELVRGTGAGARKLTSMYAGLHEAPLEEVEKIAHDALNDVFMTRAVLNKMMEQYSGSVEELDQFIKDLFYNVEGVSQSLDALAKNTQEAARKFSELNQFYKDIAALITDAALTLDEVMSKYTVGDDVYKYFESLKQSGGLERLRALVSERGEGAIGEITSEIEKSIPTYGKITQRLLVAGLNKALREALGVAETAVEQAPPEATVQEIRPVQTAVEQQTRQVIEQAAEQSADALDRMLDALESDLKDMIVDVQVRMTASSDTIASILEMLGREDKWSEVVDVANRVRSGEQGAARELEALAKTLRVEGVSADEIENVLRALAARIAALSDLEMFLKAPSRGAIPGVEASLKRISEQFGVEERDLYVLAQQQLGAYIQKASEGVGKFAELSVYMLAERIEDELSRQDWELPFSEPQLDIARQASHKIRNALFPLKRAMAGMQLIEMMGEIAGVAPTSLGEKSEKFWSGKSKRYMDPRAGFANVRISRERRGRGYGTMLDWNRFSFRTLGYQEKAQQVFGPSAERPFTQEDLLRLAVEQQIPKEGIQRVYSPIIPGAPFGAVRPPVPYRFRRADMEKAFLEAYEIINKNLLERLMEGMSLYEQIEKLDENNKEIVEQVKAVIEQSEIRIGDVSPERMASDIVRYAARSRVRQQERAKRIAAGEEPYLYTEESPEYAEYVRILSAEDTLSEKIANLVQLDARLKRAYAEKARTLREQAEEFRRSLEEGIPGVSEEDVKRALSMAEAYEALSQRVDPIAQKQLAAIDNLMQGVNRKYEEMTKQVIEYFKRGGDVEPHERDLLGLKQTRDRLRKQIEYITRSLIEPIEKLPADAVRQYDEAFMAFESAGGQRKLNELNTAIEKTRELIQDSARRGETREVERLQKELDTLRAAFEELLQRERALSEARAGLGPVGQRIRGVPVGAFLEAQYKRRLELQTRLEKTPTAPDLTTEAGLNDALRIIQERQKKELAALEARRARVQATAVADPVIRGAVQQIQITQRRYPALQGALAIEASIRRQLGVGRGEKMIVEDETLSQVIGRKPREDMLRAATVYAEQAKRFWETLGSREQILRRAVEIIKDEGKLQGAYIMYAQHVGPQRKSVVSNLRALYSPETERQKTLAAAQFAAADEASKRLQQLDDLRTELDKLASEQRGKITRRRKLELQAKMRDVEAAIKRVEDELFGENGIAGRLSLMISVAKDYAEAELMQMLSGAARIVSAQDLERMGQAVPEPITKRKKPKVLPGLSLEQQMEPSRLAALEEIRAARRERDALYKQMVDALTAQYDSEQKRIETLTALYQRAAENTERINAARARIEQIQKQTVARRELLAMSGGLRTGLEDYRVAEKPRFKAVEGPRLAQTSIEWIGEIQENIDAARQSLEKSFQELSAQKSPRQRKKLEASYASVSEQLNRLAKIYLDDVIAVAVRAFELKSSKEDLQAMVELTSEQFVDKARKVLQGAGLGELGADYAANIVQGLKSIRFATPTVESGERLDLGEILAEKESLRRRERLHVIRRSLFGMETADRPTAEGVKTYTPPQQLREASDLLIEGINLAAQRVRDVLARAIKVSGGDIMKELRQVDLADYPQLVDVTGVKPEDLGEWKMPAMMQTLKNRLRGLDKQNYEWLADQMGRVLSQTVADILMANADVFEKELEAMAQEGVVGAEEARQSLRHIPAVTDKIKELFTYYNTVYMELGRRLGDKTEEGFLEKAIRNLSQVKQQFAQTLEPEKLEDLYQKLLKTLEDVQEEQESYVEAVLGEIFAQRKLFRKKTPRAVRSILMQADVAKFAETLIGEESKMAGQPAGILRSYDQLITKLSGALIQASAIEKGKVPEDLLTQLGQTKIELGAFKERAKTLKTLAELEDYVNDLLKFVETTNELFARIEAEVPQEITEGLSKDLFSKTEREAEQAKQQAQRSANNLADAVQQVGRAVSTAIDQIEQTSAQVQAQAAGAGMEPPAPPTTAVPAAGAAGFGGSGPILEELKNIFRVVYTISGRVQTLIDAIESQTIQLLNALAGMAATELVRGGVTPKVVKETPRVKQSAIGGEDEILERMRESLLNNFASRMSNLAESMRKRVSELYPRERESGTRKELQERIVNIFNRQMAFLESSLQEASSRSEAMQAAHQAVGEFKRMLEEIVAPVREAQLEQKSEELALTIESLFDDANLWIERMVAKARQKIENANLNAETRNEFIAILENARNQFVKAIGDIYNDETLSITAARKKIADAKRLFNYEIDDISTMLAAEQPALSGGALRAETQAQGKYKSAVHRATRLIETLELTSEMAQPYFDRLEQAYRAFNERVMQAVEKGLSATQKESEVKLASQEMTERINVIFTELESMLKEKHRQSDIENKVVKALKQHVISFEKIDRGWIELEQAVEHVPDIIGIRDILTKRLEKISKDYRESSQKMLEVARKAAEAGDDAAFDQAIFSMRHMAQNAARLQSEMWSSIRMVAKKGGLRDVIEEADVRPYEATMERLSEVGLPKKSAKKIARQVEKEWVQHVREVKKYIEAARDAILANNEVAFNEYLRIIKEMMSRTNEEVSKSARAMERRIQFVRNAVAEIERLQEIRADPAKYYREQFLAMAQDKGLLAAWKRLLLFIEVLQERFKTFLVLTEQVQKKAVRTINLIIFPITQAISIVNKTIGFSLREISKFSQVSSRMLEKTLRIATGITQKTLGFLHKKDLSGKQPTQDFSAKEDFQEEVEMRLGGRKRKRKSEYDVLYEQVSKQEALDVASRRRARKKGAEFGGEFQEGMREGAKKRGGLLGFIDQIVHSVPTGVGMGFGIQIANQIIWGIQNTFRAAIDSIRRTIYDGIRSAIELEDTIFSFQAMTARDLSEQLGKPISEVWEQAGKDAQEQMEFVNKWTKVYAFGRKTLVDAYTMFRSVEFSEKNARAMTDAIANWATMFAPGNRQVIETFANAISNMATKGVLMMEDLNPLQKTAKLPIRRYLAEFYADIDKETGKPLEQRKYFDLYMKDREAAYRQIAEDIRKGQIGTTSAVYAIIQGLNKDTQGMMELGATTLTDLLSAIEDQKTQLMESVSKPMLERVTKPFLEWWRELLESEEVVYLFKELGETLAYLGSVIKDLLAMTVGALRGIWRSLPEGVKKTIVIITKLTIAVAAATAALAGLILLGKLLAPVFAAIGGAVLLALKPILIVSAAFGLLQAYIKNFAGIRTFLEKAVLAIIDRLRDLAKKAFVLLSTLFPDLFKTFNNEAVNASLDAGAKSAQSFFKGFSDKIVSVGKSIKDKISSFFDRGAKGQQVAQQAQPTAQIVQGKAEAPVEIEPEKVRTAFDGVFSWLGERFKNFNQSIRDFAKTASQDFLGFADNLYRNIHKAVSPLFNIFRSIVNFLHTQILPRLQSFVQKAVEWFYKIPENLAKIGVKMVEWGQNLLKLFADGISGAVKYVVEAIDYLATVLSFWMAPHSPPKFLPKIDVWGKKTAEEYLLGWMDASLKVIHRFGQEVQGALEHEFLGPGPIPSPLPGTQPVSQQQQKPQQEQQQEQQESKEQRQKQEPVLPNLPFYSYKFSDPELEKIFLERILKSNEEFQAASKKTDIFKQVEGLKEISDNVNWKDYIASLMQFFEFLDQADLEKEIKYYWARNVVPFFNQEKITYTKGALGVQIPHSKPIIGMTVGPKGIENQSQTSNELLGDFEEILMHELMHTLWPYWGSRPFPYGDTDYSEALSALTKYYIDQQKEFEGLSSSDTSYDIYAEREKFLRKNQNPFYVFYPNEIFARVGAPLLEKNYQDFPEEFRWFFADISNIEAKPLSQEAPWIANAQEAKPSFYYQPLPISEMTKVIEASPYAEEAERLLEMLGKAMSDDVQDISNLPETINDIQKFISSSVYEFTQNWITTNDFDKSAKQFLEKFQKKFGELDEKELQGISQEAINIILRSFLTGAGLHGGNFYQELQDISGITEKIKEYKEINKDEEHIPSLPDAIISRLANSDIDARASANIIRTQKQFEEIVQKANLSVSEPVTWEDLLANITTDSEGLPYIETPQFSDPILEKIFKARASNAFSDILKAYSAFEKNQSKMRFSEEILDEFNLEDYIKSLEQLFLWLDQMPIKPQAKYAAAFGITPIINQERSELDKYYKDLEKQSNVYFDDKQKILFLNTPIIDENDPSKRLGFGYGLAKIMWPYLANLPIGPNQNDFRTYADAFSAALEYYLSSNTEYGLLQKDTSFDQYLTKENKPIRFNLNKEIETPVEQYSRFIEHILSSGTKGFPVDLLWFAQPFISDIEGHSPFKRPWTRNIPSSGPSFAYYPTSSEYLNQIVAASPFAGETQNLIDIIIENIAKSIEGESSYFEAAYKIADKIRDSIEGAIADYQKTKDFDSAASVFIEKLQESFGEIPEDELEKVSNEARVAILRAFWTGMDLKGGSLYNEIEKHINVDPRVSVQDRNVLTKSLKVYGEGAIDVYVDAMITRWIVRSPELFEKIQKDMREQLETHSPPKLLPDLSRWGTGAADAYLEGWLKADFDIMSDFANRLEQALAADEGALDEDEIKRIRSAIAQMVAAAVEGRIEIGAVVDAMGNWGGRVEQVERLAAAYARFAVVQHQVTAAQREINLITARYDAILKPLENRLEKIRKQQERSDLADQMKEYERVIANTYATAKQKENARLKLEELGLQQKINEVTAERDELLTPLQERLASLQEENLLAQEALEIAQARWDVEVGLFTTRQKNNQAMSEALDKEKEARDAAGSGEGRELQFTQPDLEMPSLEFERPLSELETKMREAAENVKKSLDELKQTLDTVAQAIEAVKNQVGPLVDAFNRGYELKIFTTEGGVIGFFQNLGVAAGILAENIDEVNKAFAELARWFGMRWAFGPHTPQPGGSPSGTVRNPQTGEALPVSGYAQDVTISPEGMEWNLNATFTDRLISIIQGIQDAMIDQINKLGQNVTSIFTEGKWLPTQEDVTLAAKTLKNKVEEIIISGLRALGVKEDDNALEIDKKVSDAFQASGLSIGKIVSAIVTFLFDQMAKIDWATAVEVSVVSVAVITEKLLAWLVGAIQGIEWGELAEDAGKVLGSLILGAVVGALKGAAYVVVKLPEITEALNTIAEEIVDVIINFIVGFIVGVTGGSQFKERIDKALMEAGVVFPGAPKAEKPYGYAEESSIEIVEPKQLITKPHEQRLEEAAQALGVDTTYQKPDEGWWIRAKRDEKGNLTNMPEINWDRIFGIEGFTGDIEVPEAIVARMNAIGIKVNKEFADAIRKNVIKDEEGEFAGVMLGPYFDSMYEWTGGDELKKRAGLISMAMMMGMDESMALEISSRATSEDLATKQAMAEFISQNFGPGGLAFYEEYTKPSVFTELINKAIQDINLAPDEQKIDAAKKAFGDYGYQITDEYAQSLVDAASQIDLNNVSDPLYQGLIDGLSTNLTAEEATNPFAEWLDKIKAFFGIQSPSTVMRDEVGKPIAEGFLEGIKLILSGNEQEGQTVATNNPLQLFIDSIQEKIALFVEKMKSDFTTLRTSINEILELAKNDWLAKFDALYTALNEKFDAFSADWLNNRLIAFRDGTLNLFEELRLGVDGKMTAMMDGVIARLLELIDKIKHEDNIKKYKEGGEKIGQSIIEGIIDAFGSKDTKTKLEKAADSLFNAVVAAVQKAGQISSPSRVMAKEVGSPIVQGVVWGMEQERPLLAYSGANIIDYVIMGAVMNMRRQGMPVEPLFAGRETHKPEVVVKQEIHNHLHITTTPAMAVNAVYNFGVLESMLQ